MEGRQKLGDKRETQPYIVVKKQPNIPVYMVRIENSDMERVVHRNLLTQCIFLPVEKTGEVTTNRVESDAVGDSEDRMEENGEYAMPEPTDQQSACREVGEEVVGTGQESEDGGEHAASEGNILPVVPRRNAARNRCPPKKWCYSLRATYSEKDQQKIERGRKLWLRAKAKRAAGTHS